jgi:hypothetical protein
MFGIVGNVGTGKTLELTRWSIKATKYCVVTSNYRINTPEIKLINAEDFLNISQPVDKKNNKPIPVFVALDEIYMWLESRSSSSEINKVLSRVVLQSRKRGFDIGYTAQLASSVDKRLRLLTNFFIYAMQPDNVGFKYVWASASKNFTYRLPYKVAEKYYGMYDTSEIVELGV